MGKSWRRIMIILGVMSLALVSLTPAWGGDGGLDPSFNPGAGVQKIPIIRGQADYADGSGNANGNSLIYGYFTEITSGPSTYSRTSIAKLNPDGTVDTSFNIPVVGEVRGAMLMAPSNSTSHIIIWGQFSLTSGTTTYYNLAKLRYDIPTSAYVVDTTFPHIFNQVVTGAGIPVSAVNTFAKQTLVNESFTTIYYLVGGFNMQVQGDTSNRAYHLIRLFATYDYDIDYSTDNPARALPGGIVLGINLYDGNFPNQARVFGTLPRTSSQGPPNTDYMQLLGTDLSSILQHLGDDKLDGPIYAMVQNGANTPWVIWGSFKTAFETAINSVAVLKSDLSGLDDTTAPYASFNSGIRNGGGPNHPVFSGWMQGDGKVVLGGSLTSFNGTTCGYLVRLNTNGTVDTSFNTGGGSGLDDRPFRLYKPNGSSNFQITGAFRNYNGAGNPRGGIVSLDLNGNLLGNYANVTANSNTPGTVYAVEGGYGLFVIGGDFTGVGGKFHQSLALLNYDGSTNHSFVCNVDGVVNYLRGDQSGLLIAGNFGMVLGVGRTSLARVNVDYSQYPPVYSLDNSFNPAVTKADGTVAGIRGVDVDDSGNIVIMGHFDLVNASARSAIVRLFNNGDLDTEFTFHPESMPGLTKIRVNAGGNMGGLYPMVGKATYGGETRGFGCRLLHNGDLDPSFATGQSPVPHVILFDGEAINGGGLPDGQIFVCGNFTHVNDGTNFTIPRGYIAKFTPSGLLDTAWAPDGANGPIYSLYTYSNGKILMGGSFTSYNSTGRNNVARLNPNGSLDTTFNPGGGTNGPVFQVFYDDWQNRAMLGGGFTTYDGSSRRGIVRIFSGQSFSPAAIYLLLIE